jgi:hypothetical protein
MPGWSGRETFLFARALSIGMTDGAGRASRAVARHDAFERVGETRFESTTTAFDAVVTTGEVDGRVALDVQVRVPTLSAVVVDEVAPVVEEGWLETFELRVDDVADVTAADRDLEPTVRRDDEGVVVEATVTDLNERRAVDDAAAVVNYVEGTYVQGIIPGYDYTEPVSGLLDRARTGGSA